MRWGPSSSSCSPAGPPSAQAGRAREDPPRRGSGPATGRSRDPGTLDRIVRKCLRKDPSARYETAVQLAAELDRFLRNDALVHTPADTVVQDLYLWSRQHRELTTRFIGSARFWP